MKQQIIERLPSFEKRETGKVRVESWSQDDPFPELQSTGFTSPREESELQTIGQKSDVMKWYNETKGFGFTLDGTFVHVKNVISGGDLRAGARIKFDVKEGAKGPEAVSVRVVGYV